MVRERKGRLQAQDITICGLFAALIAMGAFIKIEIPVQPFAMHFTLQWLFVQLAGLLLGRRRAAMSVWAYLIIGLIGVPVFASGGGPGYLIRPTFGFLLGFALAAWVMAFLTERLKKMTVRHMLLPALAGLAVYYGTGMIYFYIISNYVIYMPVGWKVVLVNCCLLTIFPDFLLCILAAGLAARVRVTVGRILSE